MNASAKLILGEYQRTLDERFRLSVPTEMCDLLTGEGQDCVLSKERTGCLGLWNAGLWNEKMRQGIELIEKKIETGRLEGRVAEVQKLARMLSARHRTIQLAGRGRLVLPEGFREFLGVEPGGEIVIVGAGLCVELWNPKEWLLYQESQVTEFHDIFNELSQ